MKMATIYTIKNTTTKIPTIKISLLVVVIDTMHKAEGYDIGFIQVSQLSIWSAVKPKNQVDLSAPLSHLLPLYPCSTPLIALPPVSQFSISIRIAIAVSPCITQGRQPCSGASVPHTFRPGRKCLPSTIHKTGCHSPIIGLYRGHVGYKRRMSV